MAQQVEMRKISSHKKATTGSATAKNFIKGLGRGAQQSTQVEDKECGGVIIGTAPAGTHQYVFVYGKGSKRTSETRHMTEAQAEAHKSNLEKA